MDEDNKPFKEESFGTKIIIITAIAAMVIGAVGFVFKIYYFGILGAFKLLGVHYETLFSLFLFVVFYFLLGIPGEIVYKVFDVLLSKISAKNFVAVFLINTLITWSILGLVDTFMDSITIKPLTLLIVASIIAVIETVLDQDSNFFTQKNA
ncbi:hypothetical protein A8F94_15405 [Bacillus sp. FJAT-27225]|uniref:YrvL family regulatory protein n=1 Tax=Bacillus sp. FJAT-27225 TaxID=1743144 RepID=UPI00080C2DC7|nr:YrvL family regulatory protein [Bacillus sp. FJAT-27225]OCA84109.1 hypothetical protein A8F94_15405 [Bacillus sp. FJAT-27225]